MTTQPGDVHVRCKDMLKRVKLAYSTVKLMISAGQFPEPIELTPHSKHSKIAWIERELDEWQASRPRRTMRPPSNEAAERRIGHNGGPPLAPLPAPAAVTDTPAGDRFRSATKTSTAARPLTRAERRALMGLKERRGTP